MRDDFVILHVARDDVENIVGRVFLRVVITDVLRLHFVENIRVADDGETIRTLGVSRFKQATARAATRIVMAHIHFAADDIHFLREFVWWQIRVLHDVAQNINGLHRARVRHINMIHRAIKTRVGVHVTARFLHFLINTTARTRRCAFEEHMFKHMRQTRAEPRAFVNATGHRPRLRAHDRRVMIFADDDDEAVFERGEFDAGRNGRDNIFGHCK